MFLQIPFLLLGFAAFGSAQIDPTCYSLTRPVAKLYLKDDSGLNEITDGSAINPNLTTYFILHGWIESHLHPEYVEIATELHDYAGGNAILVDYEELAHKNYLTCAWVIARLVGNFVSDFIAEETSAGTMNPRRMHVIGHSLGGQTAGYIGHYVRAKTGIQLKRISAMDPAGPLFTALVIPIPWIGLSENDADVVDATHTSSVFGTLARVATVDFYVSGLLGLPTLPPSCLRSLHPFCSHWLSKSLFRESIRSCGIVGKSSNWFSTAKKAVYGLHMPLDISGVYYFDSAAQEPYGTSSPTCDHQ